jgi:hypothetical protein
MSKFYRKPLDKTQYPEKFKLLSALIEAVLFIFNTTNLEQFSKSSLPHAIDCSARRT